MIDNFACIFSEAFWYIAPLLVMATTAVSGFFNQAFKINIGWHKQLVSWSVAIVLTVLSWVVGLVGFENPVWLSLVCLSIVVGLSSNGVYDIPTIKAFINKWFVKHE